MLVLDYVRVSRLLTVIRACARGYSKHVPHGALIYRLV